MPATAGFSLLGGGYVIEEIFGEDTPLARFLLKIYLFSLLEGYYGTEE